MKLKKDYFARTNRTVDESAAASNSARAASRHKAAEAAAAVAAAAAAAKENNASATFPVPESLTEQETAQRQRNGAAETLPTDGAAAPTTIAEDVRRWSTARALAEQALSPRVTAAATSATAVDLNGSRVGSGGERERDFCTAERKRPATDIVLEALLHEADKLWQPRAEHPGASRSSPPSPPSSSRSGRRYRQRQEKGDSPANKALLAKAKVAGWRKRAAAARMWERAAVRSRNIMEREEAAAQSQSRKSTDTEEAASQSQSRKNAKREEVAAQSGKSTERDGEEIRRARNFCLLFCFVLSRVRG